MFCFIRKLFLIGGFDIVLLSYWVDILSFEKKRLIFDVFYGFLWFKIDFIIYL